MSQYTQKILNELLNTAFAATRNEGDTNNLLLSLFFAICSIIENSANDMRVVISEFFGVLFSVMLETLKPENFKSKEMQLNFQTYVASAIESTICSGKLSLNKEKTDALINLIITSFKNREAVYEEGLLVCASIALSKI
jgi:hypothetical protein